MRDITWDDFAGAVGTGYSVTADGNEFDLTLEQASEVPSAGRVGGSFRLEFVGPQVPVLPQAIYPFRHGDEAFEIFIVPISSNREGTRYEAIFY